jgi:hypothetical protein
MSKGLDWEHANGREQRKRLFDAPPIESTVEPNPATSRQLDLIRKLCDDLGATLPILDGMTTRGAHWTIKNLEARGKR